MNSKIFAAAALVMALTACSMQTPVVSRPLDPGSDKAVDGLVYSLPRSLLPIKTVKGVTTIGSVVQVPNPLARYVLEGRHALLSDDDFTLKVSNGLLESAAANSTDLTPKVVEDITTSVGNLLRNERVTLRSERESGLDAAFVIDPLEFGHRHTMGYSIDVTPLDPDLKGRIRAGRLQDASCRGASICVPVVTPVTVKVSLASGANAVETVVTVVDPTRAIGIRFNRAACAAAENAVTLKAGIMTGYDVTRPSEVAACLKIPLNVLGAIVAAPVDAITGRKARITAETELLQAQAALLAQRYALLEQELAAQQPAE